MSGRTVAVRRGAPVPAASLQAMLAQIAADNRAGGWRRLKATGRQAQTR